MKQRNSKGFLVLLIVAYFLSAQFLGWRQEQPEPVFAEIQSVETRTLRPEPMGEFYSTNYPEDISVEVTASVISEYAHYMWPLTLVTSDEWRMIVKECQGMNVNCLWPSAIAAHESHLGDHRPAYEKGNLWGIDKSGVDAGPTKFDSLQEGAQYASWLLATHYFDEGRLNFRALEDKYASQITPPDGAWAARVRYFYEDLAAELAQRVDPAAPVGIPVAKEDDPIQVWHPYYPLLEVRTHHLGMDIAAGNPDEVWLHSTLSGKVVYSGSILNLPSFRITFTGSVDQNSYRVRELDVTGWTVVIENGSWQTIMGHGAEQPLVVVGETVGRGQKLMLMGATGYVKGENPRHVHYGIRYRLPSGEWRFVKP